MKRIPDGTVLRKDNQWGIPRKCALFESDGPDSTTSGSDILEGHYDRPPEEEYSDIPNSGRTHDVYVAEELCSPSRQLEKAVVRLQQDIADYRAEHFQDHCRVWESHDDPAVRRVIKPSPDPTYPAYVVGDADRTSGTTRVAAVTGQRSGTNQLEDLLRRLLTTVESPPPPPARGACSGKVVTATGDGNTESSTQEGEQYRLFPHDG